MFISSGLILNWYYAARIRLDMKAYWASIARQTFPFIILCAAATWGWNALSFPARWGTLLLGIILYTLAFLIVAYLVSANSYERGLVRRAVGRLSRGKAISRKQHGKHA